MEFPNQRNAATRFFIVPAVSLSACHFLIFQEEYKKWQADYNEVKNLGGLYVIGTERHESRRIDNQLRGRSGRQGDPGRSRFFISLDDDLMRLFGGENLKRLMSKIGMEPGEPIFHPWLNRSIEKAQSKVEERNFDIRKHLLEYDDVLNEQRTFIYNQRNSILSDTNLTERILNTAEEYIGDYVDDFTATGKKSRDEAASILSKTFREKFGYALSEEEIALCVKNPEEAKTALMTRFKADIAEKTSMAGKDNLNTFIRFQYLQAIDKKWLDHLENLESLREAVYLRSYGQKNPLTEYKLEGFDIFYNMLDDIRLEIASRLFLVKVKVEGEAAPVRQVRQVTGNAQHNAVSTFSASGGGAKAAPLSASNPANVQVVRAVPKVGRNEPCPCGSGKKYKHCHGA